MPYFCPKKRETLNTETFLATFLPQINGTDRFLFFAPGRINLMGDHTDYTEGLVLPAALSVGTYLFVKLIPEQEIQFHSLNYDEKITLPFDLLSVPQKKWTDYPAGILVEMEQKGWQKQGLELTFFSDVPLNAGLSSSAAIETVTAFAIQQIFSIELSKKELVLLAQRAEHHFAGVQCGIMDQYTAVFGKPGKALLLDCHEINHKETDASFTGYDFVAVNTNVKHSLVQSVYNQRVEELNRVKEIINSFFDVPYLGMLRGEDHEWLDKLVEDTTLKNRLRHVVNENTRVEVAAELLEQQNARAFGELMYASHDSLAFDFEVSCEELDFLVQAASQIEGTAGARMTGAGFGGCTLNLVKHEAVSGFSEEIKTKYKEETGKEASVYLLSLSGKMKSFS